MSNAQTIIDSVKAFTQANTWAERKRLDKTQPALLLNDIAEQFLAALTTELRGYPEDQQRIQACARVLRSCRTRGVEAAFTEYTADIIMDVVQWFLNAASWAERRGLLDNY